MEHIVSTDTSTVVVLDPSTTIITTENTAIASVLVDSTDVVSVETSSNVLVEREEFNTVVAGGGQGPQGIPGSSSVYTYMLTAEAVGGHRCVAASNTGSLVYPDVNNTVVIGITTGAVGIGEVAEVQITDVMTEPSWNWTLNQPIFVGGSGVLTQTPPTSGILQVIAYPIAANKIFIDKQSPIDLG